ncbi:MAG: FAD:protein FMN transferase [Nitrospirae bacterium]|nr:FAD:protein FMN transferase [Nitrospirota bacterium]
MYTLVSITVSSNSDEKARMAVDKAFKELDRLEKMLNYYSDSSEISLINKNAGVKPVKASKETIEIIEKAVFASENTGGRFDITMAPVIALWDFKAKGLPDDHIVKERLKLVGYKDIAIDKKASTVFLTRKGMEINLGGIIKGYSADKAVIELKKNGIAAGIAAIAGDIRTFGIRPDGEPWKLGIREPRSDNEDALIATAAFTDAAISTSGDYERFFIKDGKRYHHILDPATGYPTDTCQSVTIISKEGALSDAFSTGILAMGHEKGAEVFQRLKIDAVIVDRDGKIMITDSIKERVKVLR